MKIIMKPIFSRLDDHLTKNRKQILIFAVLFFVVTRIVSMIAIGFAARLYFLYGFDAMASLRFGGSLEGIVYESMEKGLWRTLAMIVVGAPLLEECAFRLGLSFRRCDVSIGLGALTLFLASRVTGSWLWAMIPAVVVAAAVQLATTEMFWNRLKPKWLKPAAVASAVLFGLAHLFAMHGLSWITLPYALLLCLLLFFTGATFVYLRVNLGFGWAVGAHVLNNLPSVLLLLSMTIGS